MLQINNDGTQNFDIRANVEYGSNPDEDDYDTWFDCESCEGLAYTPTHWAYLDFLPFAESGFVNA